MSKKKEKDIFDGYKSLEKIAEDAIRKSTEGDGSLIDLLSKIEPKRYTSPKRPRVKKGK